MSRSIFGAVFSAAPFWWHFPQKSRAAGFEGRVLRGFFRCSSGVSWQVVQASAAWAETALVLSISPWQAAHSRGVSEGSGRWGLWHSMQGYSGFWDEGSIWGKPVGREES